METIPSAENHNDEVAIRGPIQNRPCRRVILLVSIDHKTNWPDAKVLRKPTADKGIEFFNACIAELVIPKRIGSDPATEFCRGNFEQLFNEQIITHVEHPVRDHRGNGKIGRLITTRNERLRADKSIINNKGTSGL